MHDEGYIKFNCHWIEGPARAWHKIRAMNEWRQVLYDARLIGAHPDGIGYGNISVRDTPASEFIITGSMTGNVRELGPEHFSRVSVYDFEGKPLTLERKSLEYTTRKTG